MCINKIDLHTHTTASDGTFSPEALVTEADRLGIKVLGITDHDTTAGLSEAMTISKTYDLKIIPGVELSTEYDGRSVHILGYMIYEKSDELKKVLKDQQNSRLIRSQELVEKLQNLGYNIFWENIALKFRGIAISRPHIARALVDEGYAISIEQAFRKIIGPGAPAYIPRKGKLKPIEAINLIAKSRGVSILAHPIKNNWESFFALSHIGKYKDAGLGGIEAYYTGYSEEMSLKLVQLAESHGLIVTGGSDFHGSAKPNFRLGGVRVPDTVVNGLEMASQAMK